MITKKEKLIEEIKGYVVNTHNAKDLEDLKTFTHEELTEILDDLVEYNK
jgi:hypothetical protein